MSQSVPLQPVVRPMALAQARSNRQLLRVLLVLAAPVLAEHVLHLTVGIVDTYLANHLPDRASSSAAAAAVGTVSYIIWFIGLIIGAIGTGSTAIIARAIGARHRSLANSVCGQSVVAAVVVGLVLGAILYLGAEPIVQVTRLSGQAQEFALSYLRMLSLSLPLFTLMFVANSILRGAGDTVTPAVSMIIVDLVNIFFSFGLTYGIWGFPELGFDGIAIGTVIAYVVGGLVQFSVLVYGRGGIRLHLHRLRPHWTTMKRVLRIGLPSGLEGLISWLANFAIVIVINQLDPTSAMSAAHINAIRIESISFMTGFAVATAAATMVGQSLGMKDPLRAKRSAYLAYGLGGGIMTLFGLIFIFYGRYPAELISSTPEVADLTRQVLFITGFIQCSFAAAAVFGGALRGAGDTFTLMLLSLASVVILRFGGVMIVGLWLKMGLTAIWIVLSAELFIRGVLIYLRFAHGGWRHVRV